MSDRRVTVLIPTLNEVENIDPLMERILSATKDNDFVVDIMVVDGGSTDGTQERVREWSKKASVRLITSNGKGGLSGDIVYGGEMTRSLSGWILISSPPNFLSTFLAVTFPATFQGNICSE